MYTIICVILFGLLIGSWVLYNDPYSDFIDLLLFLTPLSILGLLFSGFLGVFLTDKNDFKEVRNQKEIVALNSNFSTNGSFFLGIGNFSESKKYYYFVNTNKGVINRFTHSSNTYIKEFDQENDSRNPKILNIEYEKKNGSIWKWYIPMIGATDLKDYNIIHIPEGSIKHQYDPN